MEWNDNEMGFCGTFFRYSATDLCDFDVGPLSLV